MTAFATAARREVMPPLPELPCETEAQLSPTDRDHLGERLRAMYAQLRDEPLSLQKPPLTRNGDRSCRQVQNCWL